MTYDLEIRGWLELRPRVAGREYSAPGEIKEVAHLEGSGQEGKTSKSEQSDSLSLALNGQGTSDQISVVLRPQNNIPFPNPLIHHSISEWYDSRSSPLGFRL